MNLIEKIDLSNEDKYVKAFINDVELTKKYDENTPKRPFLTAASKAKILSDPHAVLIKKHEDSNTELKAEELADEMLKNVFMAKARAKKNGTYEASKFQELIKDACMKTLTVGDMKYADDPEKYNKARKNLYWPDDIYGKLANKANIKTLSEKERLEYALYTSGLARAMVYKYFEDIININPSRMNKALQSLSDEEKELAKGYLQTHVDDIYFVLAEPDSTDDTVTDKIRTQMEKEKDWFFSTFPNAVERKDRNGGDYVLRRTSDSADTRKDLWHPVGMVKFDTKIAELPQYIRRMIDIAKAQSPNEVKSNDQMVDDYTVNSLPFAKAVLKLFDNDIHFYKHSPIKTPGDASDEMIGEYNK